MSDIRECLKRQKAKAITEATSAAAVAASQAINNLYNALIKATKSKQILTPKMNGLVQGFVKDLAPWRSKLVDEGFDHKPTLVNIKKTADEAASLWEDIAAGKMPTEKEHQRAFSATVKFFLILKKLP